jgi:hypothetical protein
VLIVSTAPLVLGRHTLTTTEENVIAAWLAQHPEYRRATARDCDCDEELRRMRAGSGGLWKAVPDYDPYEVSGDFNGDGVDDIAVVVLDTRRDGDAFALVVFNGPFSAQPKAAFVKTGLDMRWRGLFYGSPRPKPYRLLIGRFEAEGTLLLPSGATYRLE